MEGDSRAANWLITNVHISTETDGLALVSRCDLSRHTLLAYCICSMRWPEIGVSWGSSEKATAALALKIARRLLIDEAGVLKYDSTIKTLYQDQTRTQ